MTSTTTTIVSIEDLILVEMPPRQARILLAMQEDLDQEWAADTLAAHFGWTLGGTAYHVRQLHANGYLRRPRMALVRGAVQKWYRLNVQHLDQLRSAADVIRSRDRERSEALSPPSSDTVAA